MSVCGLREYVLSLSRREIWSGVDSMVRLLFAYPPVESRLADGLKVEEKVPIFLQQSVLS
jgi:hypothetical protein